MTLRDFIGGELIDVIEWLEDSPDAMVRRSDVVRGLSAFGPVA
jgi:hypothetical protein